MSASDTRLAERRAARARARGEFNLRLARAKVDLAPAALKRRVMAEAQQAALSAAHQAIEIAGDSRGVIAGTGAALVLWLARKPIFAGASVLLNRFQDRKSGPAFVSDRIKQISRDAWRKLKEYADE